MKHRILLVTCVALLIALVYYAAGSAKTTISDSTRPSAAAQTKHQDGNQLPLKASASLTDSTKDPISYQECAALYSSNQTEDDLLRHKKYALTRFFRKIDPAKINPTQFDIIGDMAGLTRNDVFLAKSGLNQNTFIAKMGGTILLADDYEKKAEFPSLTRNLLDKAVTNKNYQDIENAIRNGAMQPDNMRFGRSLLAYLIESDPQITHQHLQALVDAGAPVNLDTLVYAIKQNISAETVKFLVEKYSADLRTTWQEDNTDINLTLASTKALRPDLMQYFLSKGVNAYTQGYDNQVNTLLDVLPTPASPVEQASALELAETALRNGVKPYRPSALERLNSWLPADVKQRYEKSLTTLVEPDDEMQRLAKELRQIINGYDEKIAHAKNIQPRCKAQHDYTFETYAANLLQQPLDTKNLSLDTKKALSIYAEKQSQQPFNNPYKIIKKMALGAIKPGRPLPESFHTNLHAATMDNQWNKALDICDAAYASTNNAEVYNSLLLQYLWSQDPDTRFIDTLLERGATAEDYNMTALARKGRVDLIEKLKTHGLTISDEALENPFYAAVQGGHNEKMLEYLIEQGVSVKPNFYGMDPLDIALEEMDIFTDSAGNDNKRDVSIPNYVALLLKAGAPVEQSHREKLQMLKDINPEAYVALQRQIPDLEQYLIP